MANGVDGHIFDYVKTTSPAFAKIVNTLANNQSYVIKGYGNEFAVTVSGLNVTIASGWAVVQGRFVYLEQPKTITVSANWSGFLVLEIDLSKQNSATGLPSEDNYKVTNNQVDIKLVAAPVKGDLLSNDTLTQFMLYKISATGTTATVVKNDFSFDPTYTQSVKTGFGGACVVTRRGDLVTCNFPGTVANIPGPYNALVSEKMPEGFRPVVTTVLAIATDVSGNRGENMKYTFSPNGDIGVYTPWEQKGLRAMGGGATWFTNDPMPS